MKKLNERYFTWLCLLCKIRLLDQRRIANRLHEIEFKWFVANDDNRLEDGRNLRSLYLEQEDHYFYHDDITEFRDMQFVSVFEVLISIATRMNYILYDQMVSNRENTAKWYEELITNLGLHNIPDTRGSDQMFNAGIDRRVRMFIDRKYDSYGNGGIFPLKKRYHRDMRYVELWDQMMLYLDENHI